MLRRASLVAIAASTTPRRLLPTCLVSSTHLKGKLMKRTILSLFFVGMLLAVGLAQETDRRAALASLVAAERAFCKAAVDHGVREAFLMNLADDSTLFRPHAVNGKRWTEASPARPGLLTWFPIYADVSRDGDLGYTTGPSGFRRSAEAKEIYTGYYMTIWKRQGGGRGKAAMG